MNLVTIDAAEAGPWRAWLEPLIDEGRATRVARAGRPDLWTAAERWPVVAAAFADAQANPPVALPAHLQCEVARADAEFERRNAEL